MGGLGVEGGAVDRRHRFAAAPSDPERGGGGGVTKFRRGGRVGLGEGA